MSQKESRLRAAITASVPGHPCVVRFVKELLQAGEAVVWASFNREYGTLIEEMGDQERLVFVDATGTHPSGLIFTKDVAFVESPTMLELVILRMRAMGLRHESSTFVVEDLERIDVYAGRDAMQEFCHFLSNLTQREHVNLDVVVPGNRQSLVDIATQATSSMIMLEA